MDLNAEFRLIEVDDVQGVTVVRILERRLGSNTPILGLNQELLRLVEFESVRHVLLDLTKVEIMTSVMLGKLVGLQKKIDSNGGKLILCNLHPRVYEVCAVAKLTRVFNIKSDEAEALASF